MDMVQHVSDLVGQLLVGEFCQMIRDHPLISDAGSRSLHYECPRPLT